MKLSVQITENKDVLTLIISAVGITFFIFFIDEGYYNFNWMKNIGNWIMFIPYSGTIFLSQLFFYKIILRGYNKKGKVAISSISGPIVFFIILTILIIVFRQLTG